MRKKKKEEEKQREYTIALDETVAGFIEAQAEKTGGSVSERINRILDSYRIQMMYEENYRKEMEKEGNNCGKCAHFQRYYVKIFGDYTSVPLEMGTCTKHDTKGVSCYNMGCFAWEKQTEEY